MGPKSDLFTREIECIMIEMVRQRPLLWDTSVQEYRRTDLKRTHWDQIAEALGQAQFTGDAVHKRFQSMESTFRVNERKIKSSKARCSGKGTDEIYKPKWDYYELLMFLKKTCAQSDTIDNLSSTHISMTNTETRSDSHISQPEVHSPVLTNIYFDENTQQYKLVPRGSYGLDDLFDTSNTGNDTSSSKHSELRDSPNSSPDRPALITTASVNIRQPLSIINDASSVSSEVTAPSPKPAALNTKRPEVPMYVKRGNSKKSNIMEEALHTIKNMAQENLPPPKMDRFDMFGAYIVSRLRSMIPEDQEFYEREILKVLTQPRLQ